MRKNKFISRTLLSCIFILGVVACGRISSPQKNLFETHEPIIQENITEDYPVSPGYPISSDNLSYPINDFQTESKFIFSFDEPINNGDNVITGSGPSGVPIVLIDMFEMGLQLSKSVVQEDGRFVFELKIPVKSGQSIGIKLGNTSGTSFDEDDFIYNESYYERPYIGILFDIAIVE